MAGCGHTIFFYLKLSSVFSSVSFSYTCRMGPQENTQEQGSRVPGLLAGGAVAGSPFLGLIGQKRIIHDPYHNPDIRRTSLEELERLARPGDVILTNKRKGTGWKTVQMPQESEFYHAQPVIARRGGQALTESAGGLGYEQFENMSRKQLYRDYIRGLKDAARGEHYSDVLLMRPKTKLTPAQQKAFEDAAVERAKKPYAKGRAMTNWLKDIFLPKIRGGESKIPAGYTCSGDVCSTLPANAYAAATGKTPFKGKMPGDIMPADYLREGSAYEPVAAHLSYKGLTPGQLRSRGLLARGGLGLGLGAATYAGVQDPTTIPIIPAAMATPWAAAKIYEKIKARQLMSRYKHLTPAIRERLKEKASEKAETAIPQVLSLLNTAKAPGREAALTRRNLLTRSLPLSIAGAAGAYGLANLLKNRFSSPESGQQPA